MYRSSHLFESFCIFRHEDIFDESFSLFDDAVQKSNDDDADNSTRVEENPRLFEQILFENIYNSHFKGVIHLPSSDLARLVFESRGKLLPRIIKYNLEKIVKGLAFPRNHRFFEVFNKRVKQMIAGGIVDQLSDEFKDLTGKKKITSNLEAAEPMTLEHLQAGFVVWLISLIFPIAVFIIEWIIRFAECIVFELVFESYTRSFEINVKNRDKKIIKIVKKSNKNTNGNYKSVKSIERNYNKQNKIVQQAQVNEESDEKQEATTVSIYNEIFKVEDLNDFIN